MKTFFSNLKKNYSSQFKIIAAITIGTLLLTVIYYFFIPLTFNYPKGTYGTTFQKELENTSYNVQVFLIMICIFLFSISLTIIKTRFLPLCHKMIRMPDNYTEEEINKIKNKLIKAPFDLMILHIIIPSIILTTIHSYSIKQFGITTLKLFIFITSLTTLFVTFLYIYETHTFKKLLGKLPYDSLDGIKINKFKSRIFTNIFPLLFVSLLFPSLIGYSHLAKEKGNLIHDKYKSLLDIIIAENEITNYNYLTNVLKNIPVDNSNYIFYTTNYVDFYNIDNKRLEMSPFFTKYLKEKAFENDNRVYEYYGVDAGATVKSIKINNENIVIGIYYNIISPKTLLIYLYLIIVFLLINYIILSIFSNSIKYELDTINNSFESMIISNDANYEKLRLTSSDEFGKLIKLYNEIQMINKDNIDKINNSRDILMERERLASLGQLISGIAHNLKTPIMSISGCTQKIDDLAIEYRKSIDDSDVTISDHKEISNDISDCVNKIRAHIEYISDIISTVKGQAVSTRNKDIEFFTISELLKKTNILLKHELKQALIYLNLNVNVDENLSIKGDINSLIQVLNNIISNAIAAYDNVPNNIIDLEVNKIDNKVEFHIKDYAAKIPDNIQKKLFKEMITTKGKNGTGLGLYISYSTIKANFNGSIDLISNDEYTDFIVTIPINNYKN